MQRAREVRGGSLTDEVETTGGCVMVDTCWEVPRRQEPSQARGDPTGGPHSGHTHTHTLTHSNCDQRWMLVYINGMFVGTTIVEARATVGCRCYSIQWWEQVHQFAPLERRWVPNVFIVIGIGYNIFLPLYLPSFWSSLL